MVSYGDVNQSFQAEFSRAGRGHQKSKSADEKESKPGKKHTFQFAHPPPINKQKQILKLRPRILLQLHLVSDNSRPSPVVDVLPSSIFPSRIPFKFRKLFRGKAGLGPQDLVLASSDAQEEGTLLNGSENSPNAGDRWDRNHIIATICHTKNLSSNRGSSTDITLCQGQSWKGVPLANGSYEFTSVNSDGTITRARWVLRKRLHHRTTSGHDLQRSIGGSLAQKFGFSLIDPTKRRHAIIASMTRECVSVNDRYQPVVDSTCTKENGGQSDEKLSSSGSASPTGGSQFDEVDPFDVATENVIETDDNLRMLITTTAIWVMFKEGWSRNFSYEDDLSFSSAASHARTGNRCTRQDDIKSPAVLSEIEEPHTNGKNPRRSRSLAASGSAISEHYSPERRSQSAQLDMRSKEIKHETAFPHKSLPAGALSDNEAPTLQNGLGSHTINKKSRDSSGTIQRKDLQGGNREAQTGVPDPASRSLGANRCREKWRKLRGAFALVQ